MIIGNNSTVAGDEDWIACSHPTVTKNNVDVEWLATLFPGKDNSKIHSWISILHANEFETFQDLVNLSSSDWESLNLPLAIAAGIRSFLATWTEQAVNKSSFNSTLIDQVDCVVMDVSSSMRSKSHVDRDKTREDVSKILFHTLMDKLVSLELSHGVGLLAFGQVLTPIGITREYERFHDELGRLDAKENSTKLYDAIFCAAEMIEAFIKAHPDQIDHINLKKRIFVLTDGEDNASTEQPWTVAQYLQQHSILLDAIPVAGANSILQALTIASGGLCFDVESEEQGMALFESEATLHVNRREVIVDNAAVPSITDRSAFQAILNDVSSKVKAPIREVRATVPQTVFAPVLSAMEALRVCEGGATVAPARFRSGGSTKRILNEYSNFMKDQAHMRTILEPFCSVDMNADDVSQWKIWLKNLPDPYTGGTWLLSVDFPTDYPFKPPNVRFVTPIYHCNVNSSGALCLDVLKDNWNPSLNIFKVVQAILDVIQEPNADDPLDAFKAQVYRDNKSEYLAQARRHTEVNASESLNAMMARYNALA